METQRWAKEAAALVALAVAGIQPSACVFHGLERGLWGRAPGPGSLPGDAAP